LEIRLLLYKLSVHVFWHRNLKDRDVLSLISHLLPSVHGKGIPIQCLHCQVQGLVIDLSIPFKSKNQIRYNFLSQLIPQKLVVHP